jgi:hypothetical protein
MADVSIGDTVQITTSPGNTMTGQVGTVVAWDEEMGKHLVRVGTMQNWFAPDEVELFTP